MTARTDPEERLKLAVLDLCKHLGLKVAHFRPGMTKRGNWVTAVQGDGKGYPDLTIVGPGGFMWRELKDDGKYPTPEQKAWLADLTAAGADADVWKPKDLISGRIKAELTAIRRPINDLTGATS